MNYRKNIKNNDELSVLAFGFMRVSKNYNETEKLVLKAIENGVNYFDTAYIYPGNEVLLGRVLDNNNLRSKIKLATKLPPYLVKKESDMDKIFNTQCERLKTDYIDYYLIHMLTSLRDWERVKGFGIEEWIQKKKNEGKIKNIGFSYHGGGADYVSIVDTYDWDFTMIQYNYFDEFNQAGVNGLKHANKKGLPIMIMEPLRGGWLASKLPRQAREFWEKLSPKRSPAEWSFRWLYNQPEVLTVLSGMNNDFVLSENIRIASDCEIGSLGEEELGYFKTARKLIQENMKVSCTGCGYCLPCPAGVDIQHCFSLYNDISVENKFKCKLYYIIRTNGHNASLCTKCGKCEKHCPQNIKIRSVLDDVVKQYERGFYKPMSFIVKKLLKQGK